MIRCFTVSKIKNGRFLTGVWAEVPVALILMRQELSAGDILGYNAAHLPVGGVISVELQLLVGVLQRNVVTNLSIGDRLMQIGDPVGFVLSLDG